MTRSDSALRKFRNVVTATNRYYDPTTDQFLSIDPDLSKTGQPYVFTNDDPLNLSDPLGVLPSEGLGETSSQAAAAAKAYTAAKKKVLASEITVAKNVTHTIEAVFIMKGIQLSGEGADFLSRTIEADTTQPFEMITASETATLARDLGDWSQVTGVIGGVVTAYNDTVEGHDLPYAVGDAGFSWSSAAAAGEAGAEACSEFGPVIVGVCGVGYAAVGGGVAHYLYSKAFG